LLSRFKIGYMSSSSQISGKSIEQLNNRADFIEIPAHDDFLVERRRVQVPKNYRGFITLHGEGETDGKERIKFADPSRTIRLRYVAKVSRIFNRASEQVGSSLVRAAIVHPGRIARTYDKDRQFSWFADSLAELRDRCVVPEICVEPRGGEQQRKLVRSETHDISSLWEAIKDRGVGVTYCIDVAQTYCAYGISGVASVIRESASNGVPIGELHMSDVVRTGSSTRIGMEIGTGEVEFMKVLRETQNLICRLLIETIGGVHVFSRSLDFLTRLEEQDDAVLL
jgi:hypothetical protein